MVREHFDASFEELRAKSNQLANTERTPENFDEVVATRVELDRLRDQATDARKGIVSRFEPPANDVVEPPRGNRHTTGIGKVGALVGAVLLAACALGIFALVQSFDPDFDLEIAETVETLTADTDCRWNIEATVQNNADEAVIIQSVQVVVNRTMMNAPPAQNIALAAGGTATVSLNLGLGPGQSCPATPDLLDHGNLILGLDNGISVSRGF